MLLLLLHACGSPSYYPDMNRYLGRFDTGVWDSPDPVGDVPCPTWTDEAVEARVVETSPAALTLYEVGGDCIEVWQGPLGDGQSFNLDTLAGAVLVARDETGALYEWTVVPGGSAVYHWAIR